MDLLLTNTRTCPLSPVPQVCLPFEAKVDGPGPGVAGLIVRKEPRAGYISTFEAVARSLAILEPDGGVVEERLLRVLRRLVALQMSRFGGRGAEVT